MAAASPHHPSPPFDERNRTERMWLALTWLAGASFAALAWMYVGYALLVAFVARFWPRHHEVDPEFRPRVSLMIMTFNEEVVIDAKLENTLRLQYPWELLEVLVVDSASTDATVERARVWESRGVRLIRQPQRAGKASAIDYGLLHATGEIAIVTDANAMMEPDALTHIVPHFADPAVGGVAGAMQQRDQSGTAESAAGDLYWRVEKVIRTAESKLHSVIGMSGEISAYRRSLFVRDGSTVAGYTPGGPDDLDQTIYMIRDGYRVVYEPRAIVWEPAPDTAHDIADQKIRVITMTIPTARRNAWALFRPRFGWYGLLTFPSRKVLPLLSPLLYVVATLASAALTLRDPWWGLMSIPLLLVIALSLVGSAWPAARRSTIIRVPNFFVALNVFVARAWLQFLRGRHYIVWDKVQSTRSALMR